MKCRKFVTRQNLLFLLVTSICLPVLAQNQITEEQDNTIQLDTLEVLGTAQEELKQAPGVSIITAEDIRKSPPVNDISEILRKQPGVNLTGNSGSGARGNNRQVDIRGMGPENTLILVDGKPISSKNSVRYGWRGDRDTRGDTNWVPADDLLRLVGYLGYLDILLIKPVPVLMLFVYWQHVALSLFRHDLPI